ncbi:hypothetical protein D3C84_1263820 [compost metagenome]
MTAAVEQQDVQILLQLADHIGQCGGHLAHFVGGSGKAALALDGVQDFEGFEGEGHVQKI